ncbi:MAG: phospholipase D family protein [Pseudomonadota bacterium]
MISIECIITRGARFFAAAATLLGVSACASLPENVDPVESYAFQDTQDTSLGQATHEKQWNEPGKSGFHLLNNGIDAFVARAVLATAAERSIDAQYYLLHNDLTGRLFVAQLLEAADRGVRVRLLVDDMDLADRDLGVAILDSHPNVQVRIFNPFSRSGSRNLQLVTDFGTITRRMHNKSFTVDNQLAILGGRNIGNEYFEADPGVEFKDLDVLTVGPVVDEVSHAFDTYWNHPLAYPVSTLTGLSPSAEEISAGKRRLADYLSQQDTSRYVAALKTSALAQSIRKRTTRFDWGDGQVLYDHPDKIASPRSEASLQLAEDLRPHLKGVQEELIIISPYFVPGRAGVQTLADLATRGVAVKILTNSLSSTDVPIVHAGYAKHRKAMLRAGIALYEVNESLGEKKGSSVFNVAGSSKASLHAKVFILDRQSVFIGSLNLDPRSVYENTEIGVLAQSRELATAMAKGFDESIGKAAFRLELVERADGQEKIEWYGKENGQEAVFDVDPYTGFWDRFSVDFMSLFPIDSQL